MHKAESGRSVQGRLAEHICPESIRNLLGFSNRFRSLLVLYLI